jgi:hypothetical protein
MQIEKLDYVGIASRGSERSRRSHGEVPGLPQ